MDVNEDQNNPEENEFKVPDKNCGAPSSQDEFDNAVQHHLQPKDDVQDGGPNDSQSHNDRDALAAAAVADFDADDQEENDIDDDTVNVIIKPSNKTGIYKTGVAYQARSVAHVSQHQKTVRQGIELDDPGSIHGVPTLEFNLSVLGDEEKPWKRPGADITDYFNYGFTEDTWIQYCEKQKILRQEYANTTLKPVLNSSGTSLLQRIRTGAATSSIRSYDAAKQGNINVINLSTSSLVGRMANANSLTSSKHINADSSIGILNGNAVNVTSLLNHFAQPPPGYLGGSQQNSGDSAAAGVFHIPPPGFPTLAPGGATHLLTSNTASANAAALFPNLSVPPPGVNNLSSWPSGNVNISSLLASNEELMDAAAGQLSGLMEHGDRSPGSVYSNEDTMSRRSRRNYHTEETGYYDRETYRSRRRSRSSSRDHYHSRHRRYRDSPHGSRDYDRRSEAARHSHRSRASRYSDAHVGSEDSAAQDGFSTSSSRRSAERRGDRDRRSRDHGRSDRSRNRERSKQRDHRDREHSPRSSRHSGRHSSGQSSRRKEFSSPQSSRPSQTPTKPTDPLAVAAAAAANIAVALAKSSP